MNKYLKVFDVRLVSSFFSPSMSRFFYSLTFFLALFFSSSLHAVDFFVPPLTSPVMDEVSLLSPKVKGQLDKALRYLNDQGDVQMTILVIDSLKGFPIEQASIQVVDQWKLGKQKTDRGLLLLIALKDRKMRLEVGQGLEGDLPDAWAKRIIDLVIAPAFRSGNPDAGVVSGVLSISEKISPQLDLRSFFDHHARRDGQNQSLSAQDLASDHPWLSRIGFFVLMIILLILFVRHPFLFFLLLSGGRGGGGFGGGGGGGRGGWSGGGGGFSGGGASGEW